MYVCVYVNANICLREFGNFRHHSPGREFGGLDSAVCVAGRGGIHFRSDRQLSRDYAGPPSRLLRCALFWKNLASRCCVATLGLRFATASTKIEPSADPAF